LEELGLVILAGDIGGTNARLACFKRDGTRLLSLQEQDYPSREHSGLDEVVKKFLADYSVTTIDQACFGVAGPVKDGRVVASNLPWVVDAAEVAEVLGIDEVALINDLEANTYGIFALEPADFSALNDGGSDAVGNIAVIAAGTGLGEAGTYWDGRRHHPVASEGGHADFAPRDALETELFSNLLARFKHVSYERVLSGSGLVHIYEFLRDTGRGEEPEWLRAKIQGPDPAAAISNAALEGRSDLCERALSILVSIYGAEAGNLALKFKATGGVFVGGGIAPKILEKLRLPNFIEAFKAKGRMRPLLETIPVRVILNDKAALLGAARRAAFGP
jgi:glucokinase